MDEPYLSQWINQGYVTYLPVVVEHFIFQSIPSASGWLYSVHIYMIIYVYTHMNICNSIITVYIYMYSIYIYMYIHPYPYPDSPGFWTLPWSHTVTVALRLSTPDRSESGWLGGCRGGTGHRCGFLRFHHQTWWRNKKEIIQGGAP